MATFHSGTDLEPLVTAAARGDAQAFATLVDHTSGLVTSIVLAILRDLDASRDVAQDVFLAAWRDLSKLQNAASFLPWLRQIARNRSHHVLRSRIRARPYEAPDVDDAVMYSVPDGRPGVDAALLAAEDRRLVTEGLDRLPDEAREVLLLFYREEQSVRQVAVLLDVSEDAVKQRLSRARAALRKDLLETLATTLRRTAPGSSFTAAVAMAISAGAPPAAAAAAATTGGLAGPSASATAGFSKLAAALGWAAPGALASIAAMLHGGRTAARNALDDDERRQWRLHTWTMVVLGTLVWGLLPVWWQLFPRPWGYVIPLGAFMLLIIVMHHVWAPRIVQRRHDIEMRIDPARARAARARERRARMVGWSVGLFFALLGLAAALWKTDW